MTTNEPTKPPAGGWDWLDWRKLRDFIRDMAVLQRSIDALKTENAGLKQRVTTLEQEVSRLSGQLEVVLNFVQSTMDDKVAQRAEAAARQEVDRLVALAQLIARGPRDER